MLHKFVPCLYMLFYYVFTPQFLNDSWKQAIARQLSLFDILMREYASTSENPLLQTLYKEDISHGLPHQGSWLHKREIRIFLVVGTITQLKKCQDISYTKNAETPRPFYYWRIGSCITYFCFYRAYIPYMYSMPPPCSWSLWGHRLLLALTLDVRAGWNPLYLSPNEHLSRWKCLICWCLTGCLKGQHWLW